MEPETESAGAGFSLPEYIAILRRRRALIVQGVHSDHRFGRRSGHDGEKHLRVQRQAACRRAVLQPEHGRLQQSFIVPLSAQSAADRRHAGRSSAIRPAHGGGRKAGRPGGPHCRRRW